MSRKSEVLEALLIAEELLVRAREIIQRQDDGLQEMQEEPSFEDFDMALDATVEAMREVEDVLGDAGKEYFGETTTYRIGEIVGSRPRLATRDKE